MSKIAAMGFWLGISPQLNVHSVLLLRWESRKVNQYYEVCRVEEDIFFALKAQNGHTNTQTYDTLRNKHQMIAVSGLGNTQVM